MGGSTMSRDQSRARTDAYRLLRVLKLLVGFLASLLTIAKLLGLL